MEARHWWRNCALESDAEIEAIDATEDGMAPVSENVQKIRELISSLELCHHKADRWVFNIIEAIGKGETDKGLGTRPADQVHPVEKVWQSACAALSAWCAGAPSTKVDISVGKVPAARLLAWLGTRSPLKEWQVQRVIERIRSMIHWPRSDDDPSANYTWLLLSAGEYDFAYLTECPAQYEEHEDFWKITARTLIRDTEDGDRTELSLALAIDMLWPCHWGFLQNLQIVLAAIGGNLEPATPFAACGRNISLLPNRPRMEIAADTLSLFCGAPEAGIEVDKQLLALLGEATDTKKWLAASLEKTIRLQLNPPADLQAIISALTGPDWIK
jgi:hypothetical protein